MNKSNYRPASKTESSLDFKRHPLIDDYRYVINDSIINGSVNGSSKSKLVDVSTQTDSDHIEYSLNKLIMFMQHLFLITMFELVFFFNYITKFEDGALIGVFNSLTSSIINSCSSLNNQSKIFVDDINSFEYCEFVLSVSLYILINEAILLIIKLFVIV